MASQSMWVTICKTDFILFFKESRFKNPWRADGNPNLYLMTKAAGKGMEKSVSSWCFIICSEICGITLIIGLSSVGSHNSAISRLWAQITCTADLLFSDYRYHILICNGMAKPNTLWDVSSAGTPH